MSSERERPVTRDALRIEPDMIAKRSASFGGGEQSSTPTDPPKADK
jgi:hypothetical protein